MALHIYGPRFSSLVRSVRLYCLEMGLEASVGLSVAGRPVAMHSPEHLALHPFGQVPVLLHDGASVFETLAICRYLDRAFPPHSLEPEDAAGRLLVEQWASALISTVDSRLIRRYLLPVAGPGNAAPLDGAALTRTEAAVEQTLAVLERQLGGQAFLCGARFSLADALLAPMLDYLTRIPGREWLAAWPRLTAYLQRLRQRPSGRGGLGAPRLPRGSPSGATRCAAPRCRRSARRGERGRRRASGSR